MTLNEVNPECSQTALQPDVSACELKTFHQSEMSLPTLRKLVKSTNEMGVSKLLTALCPAWGTL